MTISKVVVWVLGAAKSQPHFIYDDCFSISVRFQFIGCFGSDRKQCTKYNSRYAGITINGSSHVNHIRRNRFRSFTCGKKRRIFLPLIFHEIWKFVRFYAQNLNAKSIKCRKTFVYNLIWFTKFRHSNWNGHGKALKSLLKIWNRL